MEHIVTDHKLYKKFEDAKENKSMVDPLEKDAMELFILALQVDKNREVLTDDKVAEVATWFSSKIINKRIEGFDLPIRFTTGGLIAVAAITKMVAGRVVSTLIELLNRHEGGLVTSEMIADLYPLGFYKEEVFGELIDEMLKARRLKWSQIY
jgi:hypothetical protein